MVDSHIADLNVHGEMSHIKHLMYGGIVQSHHVLYFTKYRPMLA